MHIKCIRRSRSRSQNSSQLHVHTNDSLIFDPSTRVIAWNFVRSIFNQFNSQLSFSWNE